MNHYRHNITLVGNTIYTPSYQGGCAFASRAQAEDAAQRLQDSITALNSQKFARFSLNDDVLSVVVAHIQAQGWDYAETSFTGNDITVILPGYSPVTDNRYFCSAA